MFNIGTLEPPSPQEAEYIPMAVGDFSRRNALGERVGDLIADKGGLRLAWRGLGLNDVSAILSAVSEPFFSVSYVSPKTGRSYTGSYRRNKCRVKYLSDERFSLSLELEEK